eukprot:g4059.t1
MDGSAVEGELWLHVSEVPCLSCVGAMAQFRKVFPDVSILISFNLGRQPSEKSQAGSVDLPIFQPFLSCRRQKRPPERRQDGSAKAGAKYRHTESQVRFEAGESLKAFENPENCVIQGDMSVAKVLIFDNDLFPSSEFEPYLQNINYVEEGSLHNIGFKLLWSFIRFTFLHVPSIWWKSIVAIFLAQLGNAYYLMTIYLKVYLVDVCLNVKDESTLDRLLVPGSRGLTAALLGLTWPLG